MTERSEPREDSSPHRGPLDDFTEPESEHRLYGDSLDPATFVELNTTQPLKILQLREDPELIVRLDRPYYFRGEQERATEEERMSRQYAAFRQSVEFLHRHYGISSPGIVVAYEPVDAHEGRAYTASNRVHGKYFAYEHLEGKEHPEYQLEQIPESVTANAFNCLLRYYEDVVDDKVVPFLADLRLGNLMYGRLQGDSEDHLYAYDLEEYYLVDQTTRGYSGVLNTINQFRAQSSLQNDLREMKQAYGHDFPEFTERLARLQEKAKARDAARTRERSR